MRTDKLEEGKALVSIIVRTKDRPKLLKKALASISAQTYRPIEVVLVNDGGCNLNVDELGELLGDVSLNYIRLGQNKGRAHAGNVGIQNAKGDCVGFLDDDDEFYPEHVSTLAARLEDKDTDYKIVYSDSEIISGSYDFDTMEFTETDRRLFFSKDFSPKDLLVENYIPLITVMFHKDVLTHVKGIDEEFEAYEDWELLIRCGHSFPFLHVPKVTAKYIQWSRELQIAQSDNYAALLESSYDKVVRKHIAQYTPEVIRYCRDAIAGLIAVMREKETELSERGKEIASLEAAIDEKNVCIEGLRLNIKNLEEAALKNEEYIRFVHSGRGWRLLTTYYKLRDRLLGVLR